MRPRRKMHRWLAAAIAACLLSAPASVAAAAGRLMWSDGGAEMFGGTMSGLVESTRGDDHVLRLKRGLIAEYSDTSEGELGFNPRSAQLLDNGNVLIADRNKQEVAEYRPDGSVEWRWGHANDPTIVRPFSAQRLPNGNTLVCDRSSQVVEVNRAGDIVWRYGSPGLYALTPGALVDPYDAVRLPNGNTLICDNKGGNRVIEVRSSDYDPGEPSLGYTADSVVWQYGVAGVAHTGAGYLVSPRRAQKLDSGNYLITDATDSHRVIEVTPSGKIVWQFGETGVAGDDLAHLRAPCDAQRLTDGRTLITDSDNARLLLVSKDKKHIEVIGEAELDDMNLPAFKEVRMARESSAGTLLIADEGAQWFLMLGHDTSGRYTSQSTHLNTPGVRKWVTRIRADVALPPETKAVLRYRADKGPWRQAAGLSTTVPKGIECTSLQVEVVLSTRNRVRSPELSDVTVEYQVTSPVKTSTATGTRKTSGGSGSGSGGTGSGSGAQGTGSGSSAAAGSGSASGGTGGGGSNPSALTKGTGETAELSGSASLEAGSLTQIHSGFVMKSVGPEGLAGQSGALNTAALQVDPAGTAAASLLLGTCYLMGFADPRFARTAAALSKRV